MDAVVIAGGKPKPEDPLYEFTEGNFKALLDINGKPMIRWVLDALDRADKIERLIIVGLPEEEALGSDKIVAHLPTQGDLIENVRTGILKVLETNPEGELVMIVSSDIPTITPEMIDWLADTAEGSKHDAYYNVITRQVMEARFPNSNRSYVKLKGIELCGGDMNVFRANLVTQNAELWKRLLDARKSALKQAFLVGIDNLILYLLRVIDLEGAEKRISKRLNINGRAILCPYAEIGMDVDKPHQLEIVRADLEKQSA